MQDRGKGQFKVVSYDLSSFGQLVCPFVFLESYPSHLDIVVRGNAIDGVRQSAAVLLQMVSNLRVSG